MSLLCLWRMLSPTHFSAISKLVLIRSHLFLGLQMLAPLNINMASSASPAGAVPATLATTRKAFKSSVCVIPPPSCWKYIQKIRSHHDKVYRRWPPHVNL